MIRAVTLLDEAAVAQPTDLEKAGFGALETERGCLPLVALAVRAHVAGLLADVTVRQTFRNSLEVPLEATYIFPLPDRAAVTSFRMHVADRVVEGVLKDREEARREYLEAIASGYRGGIAEEERSGTFNLRVGNIPPKETVSVELTLVGMVPFVRGEAEFRFPLVVAPRYVPGVPLDGPQVGPGWGPDTDQVPDASRVTPPVLLPGFPNPVQLSLEVELDASGLDGGADDWADRIRSSLHSVIVRGGPPWVVRLQPGERLNRDFILRYPLGGEAVQTSLMFTPGKEGEAGTFALVLVPPAGESLRPGWPRDVAFVLDRSGSMEGWKMVAARRAVARMVETLSEDDRFVVLAFDTWCEFFPRTAELVQATSARWQAQEWLSGVEARGGTEMGPALVKAVELLAESATGRDRLVVLVTDGQVAGEDVIVRSLAQAAGGQLPRVFTVGIDQAVNAGFLRRLADQGGGWCELVESESQLDAVADLLCRNLGRPVLTGLSVEPTAGGWDAESVVPSRLPDVFAERPITVFGRVPAGVASLGLCVRAVDAAGKAWQQVAAARPTAHRGLKSLWGRAKVRELEDLYASALSGDQQALAKQIVATSLAAGVLSRFTAYVAVDRSEVVNPGGKPEEIVQPVEAPAGWGMFDHVPVDLKMAVLGRAEMRCGYRTMPDLLVGQVLPEQYYYPLAREIPGELLQDSEAGLQAGPQREPSDVQQPVSAVIEAVRKAASELLSAESLRVLRRRLRALIKQLERLRQAFTGKGRWEVAVAVALLSARQLRRAVLQGPGTQVEESEVRALVESIEELLRELEGSSSPNREKFWM